MDPSAFSAAKALPVEKTCLKPVPPGALEPPESPEPQALIEPSAFNAAKANTVEKTCVKPVPMGALEPPSAE